MLYGQLIAWTEGESLVVKGSSLFAAMDTALFMPGIKFQFGYN